MRKEAYAVKLDKKILRELKDFCEEMGYKQGAFVEKALKEQMQREEFKEDMYDLITLKQQEILAIPFREYDRDRH